MTAFMFHAKEVYASLIIEIAILVTIGPTHNLTKGVLGPALTWS